LIHLTERFNGKEVYLIGTANQSTMLAQRTKKLIEELKPDTVLVQTNQT
jgi:pheromone shutdown protein TraB